MARARFLDLVRAEFYLYTRFYKNNRELLVVSFVWPYIMTLLLFGIGYLVGNPKTYAERMGVENPIFYVLAASVAGLSALYILDDVAGYVLYNRWNGTLQYIFLTPASMAKQLLAASIPPTLVSPAIASTSILPAAIYFEGAIGAAKVAALYLLIVAGMLPLAGMAIIVAGILLTVREESNILSSLSAFMLFVSGLFYPVKLLPPILQAFSRVVPVTYVVEGARMLSKLSTPLGAGVYAVIYTLTLLALAYNGLAGLLVPAVERKVRRVGVAA